MNVFSASYELFWTLSVALFGLCLGSFATAMIHRLPRGLPIGGHNFSACPSCGHRLGIPDLIPVFSWLALRGKCRHCKAVISPFYPQVELATAFLALGLFFAYGGVTGISLVALAPVLVAIFVIDLKHMIIPDRLNLTLGLMIVPFWLIADGGQEMILRSLTGGVTYFLFSWGLAAIFSKLLKKEALGGGDIKFFGAAGLWLGLAPLPFFLMLSGGLGIIFALVWRVFFKTDQFPFGPALIASFILLLLTQNSVLTIS